MREILQKFQNHAFETLSNYLMLKTYNIGIWIFETYDFMHIKISFTRKMFYFIDPCILRQFNILTFFLIGPLNFFPSRVFSYWAIFLLSGAPRELFLNVKLKETKRGEKSICHLSVVPRATSYTNLFRRKKEIERSQHQ